MSVLFTNTRNEWALFNTAQSEAECSSRLFIGLAVMVYEPIYHNIGKKFLVLKRSTRFGGFSQNAILFATFAKKLVKTLKHGSLY